MQSISQISPNTQLCAIIGNPVGHSMSPAIHNRAFEAMGLDYVYLAFCVENVGAALGGMRALPNFRGMSVTIPHKINVLAHLDQIDPVDANIGSVNTIVNHNGVLKGFGTDGPGARAALVDASVTIENKNIMILGTGGAARAIAFDLAFNAKPGRIALMGVHKLGQLPDQVAQKTDTPVDAALLSDPQFEELLSNTQVLINASSAGMHPNEGNTLVPKTMLHRDLTVMDIVYNPIQTKLLKDAAEKGLQTITGVEMFVNQAALQFEAWTGHPAPKELMRQVVNTKLSATS